MFNSVELTDEKSQVGPKVRLKGSQSQLNLRTTLLSCMI